MSPNAGKIKRERLTFLRRNTILSAKPKVASPTVIDVKEDFSMVEVAAKRLLMTTIYEEIYKGK